MSNRKRQRTPVGYNITLPNSANVSADDLSEESLFLSLKKNMTFEDQNIWISKLPKEPLRKKDEEGNDILMYAMKLELETISYFLISDGYVNYSFKNNKNYTQLMFCILYLPTVFNKLYERIKNDILLNTSSDLKILSHINNNNETFLILAIKQFIKINNLFENLKKKYNKNMLNEKEKKFLQSPAFSNLNLKKNYIISAIEDVVNNNLEINDLELHHQDNDGNTALMLAFKAIKYYESDFNFFKVIMDILDFQNMTNGTMKVNINAINNEKESAFSLLLQLPDPHTLDNNKHKLWINYCNNIFYDIMKLSDFDPNLEVTKGSYLITALNYPHTNKYIMHLIFISDISTIERKYKNKDIIFYIKNKIASSNKFYKNYYLYFLSIINQKTGKYEIDYIDTSEIAINIIDRTEAPIYQILTQNISNLVFKLDKNYFYITYEQLEESLKNVKKIFYECSDNSIALEHSIIVESIKYFSIDDIIGQKGYVDFELLNILYENASMHKTIHQLYTLKKMRYIRDVISTRILENIQFDDEEEDAHFTLCNSKRGKIPFYDIVKSYPLSIIENNANANTIDNALPVESISNDTIKLKLPGDVTKQYKYTESTTIENIKQEVSKEFNIHIDNIRFLFKGKFLNNDVHFNEIPNFNSSDDMITVLFKKEIILEYTLDTISSKILYIYNASTTISEIKKEIVKQIETKMENEGTPSKKSVAINSITYMGKKLNDEDIIANIIGKDSREFIASVSGIKGGYSKKHTHKNVFKKRKSNKNKKINKNRKTSKK